MSRTGGGRGGWDKEFVVDVSEERTMDSWICRGL